MKRKIVFDLDDTLWPLNKTACEILDIDYSKMVLFDISNNPNLTSKQVNDLFELFSSPRLWYNMKWENGATEISKLENYDAEVYINSNCMNQEVANYKRSFLGKTLHIPEDRIILNVNLGPKNIDKDTFIFVDDSINNISKSNAKYNIIPAKPWNYKIENSYRFETFKDIINFITLLLKNS